MRDRKVNLIREVAMRGFVARQRSHITAVLSRLSPSEAVLDLVSPILRIVSTGSEESSIVHAAMSMASYGMEYMTRNIQYSADSGSRAALSLDPPVQDLISFEGMSNECATSAVFYPFMQPSSETRQLIKAALDKLKLQHRKQGNAPMCLLPVGRSCNVQSTSILSGDAPNRLDDDGHLHVLKPTMGYKKDVQEALSSATFLRLKFNQGFSNAIRRSVNVSHFL